MSERMIEMERGSRLYNAGDRISEKMHYTIPGTEPFNAVAGWMLEAPERDFFEVPDVLTLGESRVYPRFAQTILRDDRYGTKGVVLVDANWKAPADAEAASKIPIAVNDRDAIAKANEIRERFERSCIQAHCDQVQAFRAANAVPRAAQGLVARLLKKYGVKDPAEMELLKGSEAKSELELLREQLQKQQELINGLMAKQADAPQGKVRTAR